MNRIYKVIWSKVRNCYVAVLEMAKGNGKNPSGGRNGRMSTKGGIAT